MTGTTLLKYSSFLCLIVMAMTLIDVAKGNTRPVVKLHRLFNHGVVAEDVEFLTKVATMTAVDYDEGDDGEISCRTNDTTFRVEMIPNGLYVATDENLNYEKRNNYTLTVTCTDKATNPLSSSIIFSLLVTDVNDKPVFAYPTAYYDSQVTVYTRSPLADQHYTVIATDEDAGDAGELEYTFHGYTNPTLFTINTTADGKGKITYERVPGTTEAQSYKLTVRATDKGTPVKYKDSIPLTITFIDRALRTSGHVSYNNSIANMLIVSTVALVFFMF